MPIPFRSRESGSFTRPCTTTQPFGVGAVWLWGLGLSSRTNIRDLRPLSSPSRMKSGIRGLSLLFGRSPAGEEMRINMFCGLLVCLSVWGVFILGCQQHPGGEGKAATPLSLFSWSQAHFFLLLIFGRNVKISICICIQRCGFNVRVLFRLLF